jgi:DnaJ family protein C protein 28
LPESEQERAKRPKSLKEWQSLVEERIQSAMDEGRFDNLPGQGKPINWRQRAHTDPAQELTNGILKNNGYSPEWIDRDLAIRRELQVARDRLRAAWNFYQPDPEAQIGWQQAVSRFEETLQKINRQIDDYNLVVPILSKQRFRIELENELKRLTEA